MNVSVRATARALVPSSHTACIMAGVGRPYRGQPSQIHVILNYLAHDGPPLCKQVQHVFLDDRGKEEKLR